MLKQRSSLIRNQRLAAARALPVPGGPVSRGDQQRVAQRVVVLDDQQGQAFRMIDWVRGSVMMNSVPTPGSERTSILPP